LFHDHGITAEAILDNGILDVMLDDGAALLADGRL